MTPAPRDEPDYPERADAYARRTPGHERWPRRIAALVATGLMAAPLFLGNSVDATMVLLWSAGTVAAVVLGVLAIRHARAQFRFGDIFYIVWALLLALNGAGFLLMIWMWRDGWHS